MRSGEKICHVSLIKILPFNIQLVFLNAIYMHEKFFPRRFTFKSKATISGDIKAVFFNAFLRVHFVNENIFSQRSINGH